FITKVEREGDRVRLFGDIELIQKHLRSYDVVRKPLQSIAPDALKRSAPECRYVVTDAEGRVVLAGPVPPAEDSGFSLGPPCPPRCRRFITRRWRKSSSTPMR